MSACRSTAEHTEATERIPRIFSAISVISLVNLETEAQHFGTLIPPPGFARIIWAVPAFFATERSNPMKRFPVTMALVAVAALALASTSVRAQTPPPAAKKAPAKAFTPPKTPWGDPDLSGIYTNKDENGIP